MTIYKPNNGVKKQDKKLIDPAFVVVDDKLPLTKDGDSGVLLAGRSPLTNMEVLRRRRARRISLTVCCMFLVMLMILAAGLFLWKKYLHVTFSGMCGVKIRDNQFADSLTFNETLEIGSDHERLVVPPVMDFRQSTVVHDFEKNLTAIVDRDRGRCFILPLNRDIVKPPKDFQDLVNKFKAGYYMPNAEMVHQNYLVKLPKVDDLEPLGIYIWNDCQFFDTYMLVRDDVNARPIVKSKKRRFASECSMAGEGFCTGVAAGAAYMPCITLTDCRV